MGLGGALGAVSRYGAGRAFAVLGHAGSGFPWQTFVVNVGGAFFLGWILAHAESGARGGDWLRCFAGIGFCGAFTTFSSVNLEMLEMMRSHDAPLAAFYFFSSFACGIAVAALGAMLGMKKRVPRA
ncbi:MAG: fluoride efflux transporter FluC [Spartobacteria bacterium]